MRRLVEFKSSLKKSEIVRFCLRSVVSRGLPFVITNEVTNQISRATQTWHWNSSIMSAHSATRADVLLSVFSNAGRVV